MKGTWEKQTGKYEWGENYRIGKIIVGSAQHVSGSKGEPTKFGAFSLLPGIKKADSPYTSIEDAKARVERMTDAWFSWLEQK
jgi:hypothetical protein